MQRLTQRHFLEHEGLSDLLSLATFGNGWPTIKVKRSEFHLAEEDKYDCLEDKWAAILINGGTLVLTTRSGVKDEHNNCIMDTLPTEFKELIGAVHARGGLFFVDLPANHTGWASTLQTHHPEWFARESDGRFRSPGAWGVKWADLVELDYSHAGLRAYMAEVFVHWCRLGVDGFRCDAGYMIPAETWLYIVARVREEYPDTVFML